MGSVKTSIKGLQSSGDCLDEAINDEIGEAAPLALFHAHLVYGECHATARPDPFWPQLALM
jgi:hypothetical protein